MKRDCQPSPGALSAAYDVGRMPDSPDHIAAPGMWSYACPCLRCRWEKWWNEGDNSVCEMPDEPHPDGEYAVWFGEREKWSGSVHPND